jgi:precorrin-6B methylase 2
VTEHATEEALVALAEMAGAGAALTAKECAQLAQRLAVLEQSWGQLDASRALRLALDLYEIHDHLSVAQAACAPSAAPDSPAQLRDRVAALRATLKVHSDAGFLSHRVRLRAGGLRGAELIDWLEAYPPGQREMAIEQLLDIAHRPLARQALHPDLVDYIPSGIAPIVRAVTQVPIGPEDVLVDIGAGLGKVTMTVHLLSGARAHGVELQEELAAVATRRAQYFGLDGVSHEVCDARFVDLSLATVIFLYLPFTGDTLAAVMHRVEAAARQRSLVICTLGLDLSAYSWLEERKTNELWLAIYDSRFPGVPPRRAASPPPLGAAAELVACEGSRSPDVNASDDEPHNP